MAGLVAGGQNILFPQGVGGVQRLIRPGVLVGAVSGKIRLRERTLPIGYGKTRCPPMGILQGRLMAALGGGVLAHGMAGAGCLLVQALCPVQPQGRQGRQGRQVAGLRLWRPWRRGHTGIPAAWQMARAVPGRLGGLIAFTPLLEHFSTLAPVAIQGGARMVWWNCLVMPLLG